MLKRFRETQQNQTSSTTCSQQSKLTSPRDQNATMTPQQSAPARTLSAKPMFGQSGRATSLLGLLAAKRLTRNLRNRYGKSNSLHGSSRHSTSIHIHREPTYRMEPTRKFKAEEVENMIREIVDDRMIGFKYHPKFCSNMCKMLTDEIKDAVKKLKFDRYKIVAVVHIGERRDQSTFVASRCAWDKTVDDYATYTIETPSLFCTATVFGIYNE